MKLYRFEVTTVQVCSITVTAENAQDPLEVAKRQDAELGQLTPPKWRFSAHPQLEDG